MTENQTRTPYDAEHIAIVELGHTVWALYIPNPDQAKNPRAVADNITAPEHADVEVVATATRCYKTEGATASGWFISSGSDYGSGLPQQARHARSPAAYHPRLLHHHRAGETSTVTETAPSLHGQPTRQRLLRGPRHRHQPRRGHHDQLLRRAAHHRLSGRRHDGP
ncbi:hypothetical protein STRTUCAR8_10227 [Streptomyces turgidiscabies Car8]|uniref:Uncharacterized protein n=1 Tax=Streptomyces turgidiscabies (strain Car8) TaxID=698760 RepID=L7F543_STRT8|nr:hypothetical protein STRTUCAR8_10227 [Streptomyces turgidiscabies Car8]